MKTRNTIIATLSGLLLAAIVAIGLQSGLTHGYHDRCKNLKMFK